MLVITNLLLIVYSYGQIYKVDDYGAKGDGVTDDRYAIQKALNDLKSNGGEVQFTSGKEYIINAGLEVIDFPNSKNYKITTTGEGKAIIKIADGAPLTWSHWVFRIDRSENVEMNNLILDGNRDTRNPTEETSGTDCILVLDKCNGLRLRNVHLKNGPCDNIYIAVRDHSDPATFLTDFEMYNCVLENAWRNNMSVIRGKNFKIIGCEFKNANGYAPEAGIDFEPNRGGDSMGYKNMLVEGCTFRNNNQYGLYLTDIETESGYSIVKNNIFDNNALFIASEYNIAKNNIFINLDHMPTFSTDNDPRDGIIYFHVNNESNYNKVYNNYFFNNPTPPEMHLINFMGNAGENNEAFNNYAYNNNVAGFVNRPDGQIVYGNTELNKIEM
jgi:polygalacturonase